MEQENKRSRKQWEAYIELNANKFPGDVLMKEMMADGYSEQEVKSLIMRKKQKAQGLNIGMMVGGVLITLIGIGLSQSSYEAASGGGTYYVFWGAVVVGIVSFFVGLYRLLSKK